jgi:hypothetical protein
MEIEQERSKHLYHLSAKSGFVIYLYNGNDNTLWGTA